MKKLTETSRAEHRLLPYADDSGWQYIVRVIRHLNADTNLYDIEVQIESGGDTVVMGADHWPAIKRVIDHYLESVATAEDQP